MDDKEKDKILDDLAENIAKFREGKRKVSATIQNLSATIQKMADKKNRGWHWFFFILILVGMILIQTNPSRGQFRNIRDKALQSDECKYGPDNSGNEKDGVSMQALNKLLHLSYQAQDLDHYCLEIVGEKFGDGQLTRENYLFFSIYKFKESKFDEFTFTRLHHATWLAIGDNVFLLHATNNRWDEAWRQIVHDNPHLLGHGE